MVVNLSVVDNPKILVFICNRLLTSLYINNAETAHGYPNISFHEKPIIVRSAMHNLPVHRQQRFTLHLLLGIGIENSANSTHGYDLVLFEPVELSLITASNSYESSRASFVTSKL